MSLKGVDIMFASSSQEAATRLFFLVAVLAPFKEDSVKKTCEIHSGAAFLTNFCVKSHKLDLREDADRPASWRSIRPLEEPGFDASCPGCQDAPQHGLDIRGMRHHPAGTLSDVLSSSGKRDAAVSSACVVELFCTVSSEALMEFRASANSRPAA